MDEVLAALQHDECLLEAQLLQPHAQRLAGALDAAQARLHAAQAAGADDPDARAEVDRLRRTLPADYVRWEAVARGSAGSVLGAMRRMPTLAQMRADIEAAHGADKVRTAQLGCCRARVGRAVVT